MKTAIRKMGNSQGILIPKPFLMQTGLDIGEVEIQVQDDAIVIRKPRRNPREGWADACRALASQAGEQPIVWPLLGASAGVRSKAGEAASYAAGEPDAGIPW